MAVKLPEMYYAEWIDSCTGSSWASTKQFNDDVAYCRTIGWLVRESKDSITLAGTIAEEKEYMMEQVNNYITIPRVSIKILFKVGKVFKGKMIKK